MITGRVPIGIAYCPQCGSEVYLDSAERYEPEALTLDDVLTLSAPTHYWLTHGQHEWVADSFEVRLVFAMEVAT